MLAELDVVVFLKMDDPIERAAERVSGSLGSQFRAGASEEWSGPTFEAAGLGLHATFFANQGDDSDPEYAGYHYGLEIVSQYWCVEMDAVDMESPLGEYFARKLAFDLDVETATELLLENTEDGDIMEVQAYRRNPQFRLDQMPTNPKVFVIETRQIERRYVELDDDQDLDENDDTTPSEDHQPAP